MLRRFIACLALLTGLFAGAVPASAASAPSMGVAVVVGLQADVAKVAAPRTFAGRHCERRMRSLRDGVPRIGPAPIVAVAIIGIDRSRE